MRANYENIPLAHDEAGKRFEIDVDGKKAFINYHMDGDTYVLNHTEADPELEGKGAAGALVEKVMQELKNKNASMIPTCPYISNYIKKHPGLDPNI